jgi:hypothetical protein
MQPLYCEEELLVLDTTPFRFVPWFFPDLFPGEAGFWKACLPAMPLPFSRQEA